MSVTFSFRVEHDWNMSVTLNFRVEHEWNMSVTLNFGVKHECNNFFAHLPPTIEIVIECLHTLS